MIPATETTHLVNFVDRLNKMRQAVRTIFAGVYTTADMCVIPPDQQDSVDFLSIRGLVYALKCQKPYNKEQDVWFDFKSVKAIGENREKVQAQFRLTLGKTGRYTILFINTGKEQIIADEISFIDELAHFQNNYLD